MQRPATCLAWCIVWLGFYSCRINDCIDAHTHTHTHHTDPHRTSNALNTEAVEIKMLFFLEGDLILRVVARISGGFTTELSDSSFVLGLQTTSREHEKVQIRRGGNLSCRPRGHLAGARRRLAVPLFSRLNSQRFCSRHRLPRPAPQLCPSYHPMLRIRPGLSCKEFLEAKRALLFSYMKMRSRRSLIFPLLLFQGCPRNSGDPHKQLHDFSVWLQEWLPSKSPQKGTKKRTDALQGGLELRLYSDRRARLREDERKVLARRELSGRRLCVSRPRFSRLPTCDIEGIHRISRHKALLGPLEALRRCS